MPMLRRFLLLVSLCLLASSVVAQDAPPPAAPAQETIAQEAPAATSARQILIDVLEDPESRAALIEQLKAAGASAATQPAVPVDAPAAADTTPTGETASEIGSAAEAVAEAKDSFAVRLGEYTRLIADDIGLIVANVTRSLRGVTLLATGQVQVKWYRVAEAATELAGVLISAFLVFWLARLVLRQVLEAPGNKAKRKGWLWRSGLLILISSLDVATVLVGWAAGYAAALTEFASLTGGVSLLESLALNAFLITGLAKAGLRFVFAPKRSALRLLPFSDAAATFWCKWLGVVVSVLVYGLLLGVPIANLTVSVALGNTVRLTVVVIAALMMVNLIWAKRRWVCEGITAYAETLKSDLASHSLKTVAGIWHWIALSYIAVVVGIWISRPFDAVALVLRATGLSILTIMAGILVTLLVTRAITDGIHLPANLRASLPALEGRLNAFVPRMLRLIRVAVFIVTTLVVLDLWYVIDFFGWLNSPGGSKIVRTFGSAALVLVVAFTIWLTVMSWIDLRLRERAGYVVTARERTLFQLFRNAFTVVIVVMAALLSLSEIGVDIGPLIAGAGVVGLAISFGAQTLVKDIITGAFIQIENAINEGDVVTVGGVTGTVERLTVRSVRLRDLQGTTHIIPFSSVDMVANFMRKFSYHVALIGVSYDTDIPYAKDAMQEAFRQLADTDFGKSIIGDLEMHGVTNFGASSVDIRARIKTLPGMQWGVGRAYNEFIKQVFDERGIEIPFPQVTYHSGGKASESGAKLPPPLSASAETPSNNDG